MLSWVVLNFIPVIYSNAPQLTYSLIGPLSIARRVIWMRSAHPSLRKFSWGWLFSFFWNSTQCQGFMWCCEWQSQIFWKCFVPQMGNRPSLGFFEYIGKFVFFSIFYFFHNLVFNESLYYHNCCMLKQISYLGKFR